MGIKKMQEREYAKLLYLHKKITQKEIAQRVGITEKTLKKWIEEETWEDMRLSVAVTRKERLKDLMNQLDQINQHIKNREAIYDVPKNVLKENPNIDKSIYPMIQGNFPTSKEADIITKLTNSIKKIEDETGLGETLQIGMTFINYVKNIDFALAQKITPLFDMWVKENVQKNA